VPDRDEFDARLVRAFVPHPGTEVNERRWPASVGPARSHLLELGPWGIRPATWNDLGLVVAWRQFMRDPQSYFRHMF
jgi:hypothetical protein